jgi:hypothetical protein
MNASAAQNWDEICPATRGRGPCTCPQPEPAPAPGTTPEDPPLTHFFHCWRSPAHHACAVALIERQGNENTALIHEAGRLERELRDAKAASA